MPRFLACGDLHLDAGPDLGHAPGDRLREQEDVWREILELAVDQEVDAVLFAGDAFHKARPTPEAMLAFERPLVDFTAGLPVIAILGNHDVAGVSLGTGLEVFAEAGLLTLAREPAIHRVAGVSVCCLPWVSASRLVAAQGGGDRDDVNEQAAELLLATARGLRDQVEGPAILLTHFSISGSALPNGLPVDQLREPVLELGELEALEFDAICAGHIHKGQHLATDPNEPYCPIFFVGSPMPLSFGETGYEHGVWILETHEVVRPDVLGFAPRFIPIESRRLVTLDVEVDKPLPGWHDKPTYVVAVDEPEMFLSGYMLDNVRGAIVKVRIRATQEAARRLDVAALKRSLYEAGAHKVYAVQLEVEKPERARVEGMSEELDELEALGLWLAASGIDGVLAERARDRTQKYLEEIVA